MSPYVKTALAYTRYRYPRFRSRAHLEAWQGAQIRWHLRWVTAHSPFYRRLYKSHDLARWRSLPTISREDMMAHFDTLNTASVSREEALRLAQRAEQTRNFSPTIGGLTVGLSSGTSGQRGLFLVSEAERTEWAGAALARALPTISRPQRVALFLRANSALYTSVRGKRVTFAYFDLAQDFCQHFEQLNALQPTVLAAPPSALRLLGTAMEQGQLDISPQKVIAVAEVLDPLDRKFITHQFAQPVHQLYQATEGFLGFTCSYGTLHLNEDILAIQKEYVEPKSGRFIPVITDFRRRAQPVLRYRLEDILTERREPCPCGSVFLGLERVEGRVSDVLRLRSTSGSDALIFPSEVAKAMLTEPGLEHYLVCQRSVERLTVALSPWNRAVEQAVHHYLAALLQQRQVDQKIDFAPYTFTPGVTKLRRVQASNPPFHEEVSHELVVA